ncbi:MAG TPA: hypothetical protein VK747_23830 [Blastocatellia bacterium]|jgi:hypothetical protein|nr:hypothetical protein [Blastocatellia bacterium]
MKRNSNKTSGKARRAQSRANGSGRLAVTLTGDQRDLLADSENGEVSHPGPVRINPESKEKREKRLAARKARTLRAFQMAYEDHHRRKAS